MRDESLLLASLFLSFAGILILFFLGASSLPGKISVGDISQERVGEKVLAEGVVRAFYYSGKAVFFDLCSGGKCVSVVDFAKSGAENGAVVSVEGRVQEYNGRIEILAEKIEVLRSGVQNA